jgi:hypothetical protein
MKNENEIKRAFAMEVIERLENNKRTGSLTSHDIWANRIISESVKTIQSLLPKEEEVDWSKALADCKNKFPIGTAIIPINVDLYDYKPLNNIDIIGADNFHFSDGKIWVDTKTHHCAVVFDNGKWAEIVEPETKTESDEVKAAPEIKQSAEVRAKFYGETKFSPIRWSLEGKTIDNKWFIVKSLEEIPSGIDNKGFKHDGLKIGELKYAGLVELIPEPKPQPTIEQKARKKAEEIRQEWKEGNSFDPTDAIYQALLIDPKTL